MEHVGTGALARSVERSSTKARTPKLEKKMKAVVINAILLMTLTALTACNSGSHQPNVNVPSSVQASTAKRYHLKGKVVSIDKPSKMAIIDGEDVPGFMAAMTMPYQVKPETELDKLSAGDSITADIVVQDDNGWLENIVVTEHAGKK
jgi:Cu/Ag efflux protein CusF